jgi:kynurenine formamidase
LLAISQVVAAFLGCSQSEQPVTSDVPEPRRIVDLGTSLTENIAEEIWGTRYVNERGFNRPNEFEVTRTELYDGALVLQNGFYTVFNHGGPHVDAPNHIGLMGGIDSYPVEAFSGPLKVFDVSHFPPGRTITIDYFDPARIKPGDVVLIYTGYEPPRSEKELPASVTLQWDTAEWLANIPIRAYGTDARSVASLSQSGMDDPSAAEQPESVRGAPVHHAFLQRGIPIYEQLFNLSSLLDEERMFFTGTPVSIEDGDGMIVRPVVLVY